MSVIYNLYVAPNTKVLSKIDVLRLLSCFECIFPIQRYNIQSRKPTRSVMRLILASSVPHLDIPNHNEIHRSKAHRFQTSQQTESKTLSINHPQNNRTFSENRRTCRAPTRDREASSRNRRDETAEKRSNEFEQRRNLRHPPLSIRRCGADAFELLDSVPTILSLSLSSSSSLRLAIFPLRPSVSLHLSRFYDALSRGRRSGMR